MVPYAFTVKSQINTHVVYVLARNGSALKSEHERFVLIIQIWSPEAFWGNSGRVMGSENELVA